MDSAHHYLFLAGALGLVSIFAGLLSRRVGAPLLLVFLGLGLLAGEGGPGGLRFDDFHAAYLIGSIALAIILFEGGLKTHRRHLRLAFWPAFALATAGVAVTAGIVGSAIVWFLGPPWVVALLIASAVAPTDAAAVASLLSRDPVAVPARVRAVLEIESGLNDPMSVFLTVLLTQLLLAPETVTPGSAGFLLAREMLGGLGLGIAGGYALVFAFRGLELDAALGPVLAFMGALTLFGGTQTVGASGFLAVYVAGVIVATGDHGAQPHVARFFEALSWLAQIVLFLMLGLLATPRELLPHLPPSLLIAAVLIFVARPAACALCLVPFRFTPRETVLASWVGLRGAVPIYLMIIPLLAGARDGGILFSAAFVMVVISLLVQGWTIRPATRLLGFRGAEARPHAPTPPDGGSGETGSRRGDRDRAGEPGREAPVSSGSGRA